MLTSSDAKWRCMWHLLVWSLNLTMVSQFLKIGDHVAFYIIAAISVIILPVLTAIYSNTSGRHGAGLLRAGLVFCDPVLACLTVTPLLLLNHLPSLVDEIFCLEKNAVWNETLRCIINHTDVKDKSWYTSHDDDYHGGERQILLRDKKKRFLIIQGSIITPILLALLMGKRTRKMNYTTYLFSCAYWLVTSIEATDLLQSVLYTDVHKHVIYTTEAMTSIIMIITTSYAIITLISYISPEVGDTKDVERKFDFLYKVFAALSAICFCEVPFVVARCRTIAADVGHLLPGTFYFWLIKDVVFIGLLLVMIYIQKFGNEFLKLPCKPHYDAKDVFLFEPEKRDRYINRHKKVTYSSVNERDEIGTGARPKSKIEMTNFKPNIMYSNKVKFGGILRKQDEGEIEKSKETDAKPSSKVTESDTVNEIKAEGKERPSTSNSVPYSNSLRHYKRRNVASDSSSSDEEHETCEKKPVGGNVQSGESIEEKVENESEKSRELESVSNPDKKAILIKQKETKKLKSDTDLQPGSSPSVRKSKNISPRVRKISDSEMYGASPNCDRESCWDVKKNRERNKKMAEREESDNVKNLGDTQEGTPKENQMNNNVVSNVKNKDREASPDSARSPSARSPNDPDDKKEKRVTFKFDMGRGTFLELKSRSDSPPVIVHDSKSPK